MSVPILNIPRMNVCEKIVKSRLQSLGRFLLRREMSTCASNLTQSRIDHAQGTTWVHEGVGRHRPGQGKVE
jgi:hypothetical protein